jgi:hypothetical protein
MITNTHSSSHDVMIGRVAKVKSLEPITSTCAPSLADVVEYSEKKVLLRVPVHAHGDHHATSFGWEFLSLEDLLLR